MVAAPVARLFVLVLVSVAAGSGCGSVHYRTHVVQDGELRRDGLWTPADARARALILAEGLDSGTHPVRLPPRHRELVDELELGDLRIPLPKGFPFSWDLGYLFGFSYQPHYHHLPGQNAFILLGRDRAPGVIAVDPDRPVGTSPDEPAEVWERLRDRLERDLEGVSPLPDLPPDLQP